AGVGGTGEICLRVVEGRTVEVSWREVVAVSVEGEYAAGAEPVPAVFRPRPQPLLLVVELVNHAGAAILFGREIARGVQEVPAGVEHFVRRSEIGRASCRERG